MKQRVYVSTNMCVHLWGRWYVDMTNLIETFSLHFVGTIFPNFSCRHDPSEGVQWKPCYVDSASALVEIPGLPLIPRDLPVQIFLSIVGFFSSFYFLFYKHIFKPELLYIWWRSMKSVTGPCSPRGYFFFFSLTSHI